MVTVSTVCYPLILLCCPSGQYNYKPTIMSRVFFYEVQQVRLETNPVV